MIERKTFTFDGENSADYGLYISGDSVYNAPNREIDMVSIPGRNGQLAIDMGRYENITVTYPAFVIADTQAEFREKIRRIRNWLCSKTSYQRLTDEYNPESFRLGLYKSGLEVEPIFYNRCGEFEMSFDCQPQRFLFTGEEVFTLGEWGETETYSGSIVSFEGTETTAIKSLIANITPKQSGSGDPSPSNVRPISGYEGVNVTRCGKNLCKYPYDAQSGTYNGLTVTVNADGSVTFNGTATSDVFFDLTKGANEYPMPKGTYVLHKTNSADIQLIAVKDRAYWGAGTTTDIVRTSTEDFGLSFYVYIKPNIAFSNFTIYPMFELGSTATPYEPYQGNTYPISLGQTVYGGTLDVVSGKLTITRVAETLNGMRSVYRESTKGYFVAVPNYSPKKYNRVAGQTDAISSCFKLGTGAQVYNNTEDNIFTVASLYISENQINIRANAYADGASLKNALGNEMICYELETPIEITLTPTQVTTLLGNNNIWADSGSVEVEIGENPYILVNPTKFEACPIFEVEGAGTLSIGDTTLTISNTGTTIIDTEMMEAYEDDNGAIISRNDDVEGGFPTLNSGINTIDTDGLTSVKVTPKFWEL